MTLKNTFACATLYAGMSLFAGGALAQDNPPPSGNVIYSLTGQAMSGTYSEATVNFTATLASTNFAIAIREDPAFIEVSNVSLVDLTTGGSNLLVNGDFSGGTSAQPGSNGYQEPDGWTYLNIYDAEANGEVLGGCGLTGNNCYFDGSVGSYDAISQLVSTVIGDTYQVSFYYLDTDPDSMYEPSGEGSGRDLFVYAGAGNPQAAPEPASLAILVAGLTGLTVLRRRRAAR